MLRVQDLKFERGDYVLFDDVNLVVYPGQRVAVVGRNGVGKSTFFNLVLKKLEASGGEVDFPEDWQVGYMAQEVEINDRPLPGPYNPLPNLQENLLRRHWPLAFLAPS